jgi:tryptophan synthase alpha chain
VVDLPPEESDELTCAWGNMLDFIRLVAPTTSQGRMARIAAKASGFIYLVSMTGTTGSDGLNLKEIKDVAIGLRRNCNGLPICIGFGISTPEDAAKLSEFADGIVVGSAFERLIESGLHSEITPERVGELVARLKLAIH